MKKVTTIREKFNLSKKTLIPGIISSLLATALLAHINFLYGYISSLNATFSEEITSIIRVGIPYFIVWIVIIWMSFELWAIKHNIRYIQAENHYIQAGQYHIQGRDLYETGNVYLDRGEIKTAKDFYSMASDSYAKAIIHYIDSKRDTVNLNRVVRNLGKQFLVKLENEQLSNSIDGLDDLLDQALEKLSEFVKTEKGNAMKDNVEKLRIAINELKRRDGCPVTKLWEERQQKN